VRNRRLLDSNDEFPGYEGPLVAAIESTVHSGDDVLLIGGGLGVSTVIAGRHVGISGTVHTIEASSDRLPTLRETVKLNGVQDRVTIQHGIVETAKKIDGDAVDAPLIEGADLPACDVLISDCEGAESQLLEAYSDTPRAIVVETHGVYDSPTEEVVATLNENGYSEQNRAPESTSDDVMVVTAVR